MKIVFHEKYRKVYARDPAAAAGRMEPVEQGLREFYQFIETDPAGEEDVALVHTKTHIENIRRDSRVFPMALCQGLTSLVACP